MVVHNPPIGPPRLCGLVVIPGSAERVVRVAEVSASQREDPQGWYQGALQDDGSTTGVNVQRLPVTSLSAHDREETRGFTRHTLEGMDGRVPPLALPADRYTWALSVWCVLVKTEQRALSHAGILYRVVQVGEQWLAVVAVDVSGCSGEHQQHVKPQ